MWKRQIAVAVVLEFMQQSSNVEEEAQYECDAADTHMFRGLAIERAVGHTAVMVCLRKRQTL